MPFIQWNETLSIGIDSIDEQHKTLVDMINSLSDALEKGETNDVLQKIFNGLADYTVSHFGYEEELLEQCGYTESEAHKNEHKALYNQVRHLQKKLENGDFTISVELMSFLKGWVTNHILKTDKAYAPFLITQGVR